jgi:hypothetical protein
MKTRCKPFHGRSPTTSLLLDGFQNAPLIMTSVPSLSFEKLTAVTQGSVRLNSIAIYAAPKKITNLALNDLT